MKSAVETLDPTRVRLTVEVPFEELTPNLDAAYKKIATQVSVPGFRKGKVPRQIIDQRFGRAVVLEEAINEALPRLYTRAVVDNNVRVIGQPAVDVTELADGERLTFTAEVEVRPDIELPEYGGIEVTVDDADVADDQVIAELDELRARFGSLVTVERAAQTGDFVQIDLSASQDGEEIEDAQAKGISYEVGSNSILDGLDDALTGLSADESATFRTTLVSGERSGDEVDVSVTIGSVKERNLPALDDEFALLASEYDTLDELKAGLRERIERVAVLTQAAQARDRVLDALLDKIDLPLPERVLADAVAARRRNLEHQLGHSGIELAALLERQEKTEDELIADFTTDAERALKAEFVLDAIADAENVSVSEGELGNHIVRSAMRYGVSPDDFAKQVIDAGQQSVLVAEVRRAKALGSVVDAATVTDASGRTVDLKALAAEADADDADNDVLDVDVDADEPNDSDD